MDQDGTEDHYDDDIDGDGLTNADELAYNSDPRDKDSKNRPPSDINASNLAIAENSPVGSVIGKFTSIDPDGDGNSSFSLVTQLPEDIAFALWLDASDTSTITHSNSLVSRWADKSGRSRHATQSNDLKKPFTNTRKLNGLNLIKFEEDFLLSSLNLNRSVLPNISIFAVFATNEISSGDGVIFGTDNGGWDRFLCLNYSQNAQRWGISNSNGTTALSPGRSVDGYYHIVSVGLRAGQTGGSYVSLDGRTPTVFSEGLGDSFSTTAIGALSPRGDRTLNGVIGEIIFTSSIVPQGDHAVYEGYLAHKWGLRHILPVEHSFKNGNHFFRFDSNGTLFAKQTFDFETDEQNYSITVRVTDDHNISFDKNFTISLTNVVEDLDQDGTEDHYDDDIDGDGFTNAEELAYGSDPLNPNSLANSLPTDLNSTAVLAVQENQPVSTAIGEFNATDPDGDAITYHFVNGENNNSLFTLDTNGTLKTATTFDFESNASSYTISVQAKDEVNATTEGNFTVTLLDVNEPPYELYPTTALSITENQPVGSVVGKFKATDPEGAEVTFSLGANDWETHNELFSLDANGTLRTAKQIDYETYKRWKKVRVNATDALGETVSELFRVVVEDVNDAPVVSGLGASEVFVQEGQVFKSGFTWDMTYGGMGNDTFKGMVPAHDGGYLIVGTSDSNKSTHKSDNSKGGTDYWLIKVNEAGERIWDKSYGGSEDDSCSGIIPTKDGNYLLFGSSKSPDNGDKSQPTQGSSDFWILKIDANGSKIWDKRFGGGADDSCQFAMQLENGDFALGGSSRSGVSGDKKHAGFGDLPDYWVLRVDENGTKLWDYTYGGEDWDVSNQMGVLPDGNWLIFGYSRSNKGEFKSAAKKGGDDYWVVKVDDQNGSMIWDQSYGGAGYDYLYDAHVLADGSFFMVGASRTGSANTGDRASLSKTEDDAGSDLWLVKADANGSILWERAFGGEGSSGWPAKIEALSNEQFAISSTISGRAKYDVTDGPKGALSTDYWLIKIDIEGNKIWDRRFEGDSYEFPANLMHTRDGGILLGGSSNSHAGFDKSHTTINSYDFWVLKLDEDGRKRTLINDPDGDDLTWSIAEGKDGDYFEVNSSTGQIFFKGADFEKPSDADANNSYDLTLRATDPSGQFAEHNVTFVIQNVNEPPYDLNSTSDLTILENQPVGTIVGKLTAKDQDEGDQLLYRLVRDREQIDNELFTLDENGTLSTAAIFDYEKNQTFHIRVKVTDQAGLFEKESFYISVVDIADENEKPDDNSTGNVELDNDGDGFSNQTELAEGTNPNDKYSYPNKPILITKQGVLNTNGSIDLSGTVRENGKGTIIDFGFVISSRISIDPQKSTVYWVRGVGEPEGFKLTVTESPFEQVMYFRAWARNVAGYGIGPVKKVVIPEAPKPWWGTVEEMAGGWQTSDWFGTLGIMSRDGFTMHGWAGCTLRLRVKIVSGYGKRIKAGFGRKRKFGPIYGPKILQTGCT